MRTPFDPSDERLKALRSSAARAAILLDFDGTLSPIVERPELARIDPGIREVLGELVPAYALVAVVSGRPRADVTELVGVDRVQIAGLYGLGDEGELVPVSADVVGAVTRVAQGVPGSAVERKGATIALHLRGADDPEAARAHAEAALAPVALASAMRLLSGKRVLEIVPLRSGLKDSAVQRLLASADVDAALYAGDDLADLAAFEALDRAGVVGLKVAVHGPETPPEVVAAADLVVDGPEGMRELLRALAP